MLACVHPLYMNTWEAFVSLALYQVTGHGCAVCLMEMLCRNRPCVLDICASVMGYSWVHCSVTVCLIRLSSYDCKQTFWIVYVSNLAPGERDARCDCSPCCWCFTEIYFLICGLDSINWVPGPSEFTDIIIWSKEQSVTDYLISLSFYERLLDTRIPVDP